MTACQLATARQTFSDAEDAKSEIPRNGAVKASERQMRMEVICEEQIKAWTQKMEEVKQEGVDRAILWEERRAVLDSRGAEVLQLFVEKIRAANTLAGEVATVEVKAPVEPPKVAEAPTKAAKEEAKAKTEAQEAFKVFEATVQVAKADLPDLTHPPVVAPAALPVMQTM